MKTGNLRKILLPVLLILLTSMFACSAGRDVYEVGTQAYSSISNLILPDSKPVLKKKILITPVINAAGISSDQAEAIKQDCISYLSKDKYLYITTLKQWDENTPAYVSEAYGRVINPAYAEKADKVGVNILLALVIHPIEVTKTRTGIWPFRRDTHEVLVSLSLGAMDSVDDTRIIYDVKTSTIKMDNVKPDDSQTWAPYYDIMKKKVSSMTKKLCSSFADKIRKYPWQSKVIIDGDNYVINGGKNIGVTENTVFELFKKGEPIYSYSGEKFDIFGVKLGETGVKSLSEDKTVLAATADGSYKEAAFVRVKR